MDLDSFLVSLYVLVDDWWQAERARTKRGPGRTAVLSEPEVLTLAILAQWPRFRGERDFWRFAEAHLRPYFPDLCTQGQLNRRIRALEPEMRALQRAFSTGLSDPFGCLPRLGHRPRPGDRAREGVAQGAVLRPGELRAQRVEDRMDLRVQGGAGGGPRGRRHRLRAGPGGLRREAHRGSPRSGRSLRRLHLADKGFAGIEWERRWMEVHGALVAATPKNGSRRAWTKADRRWAAGKRQIIEGVIYQLKDFFGLERHRAKALDGLLARPAAKVAAYTCAQRINRPLGRPLRHLADLLV